MDAVTTVFTGSCSDHQLREFGALTGLDGPTHIDPEYATPRFGGLLVQGLLLAEIALSNAISSDGLDRSVLLRSNLDVRFLKPVIVGQRIEVMCSAEEDHGRALRVVAGDDLAVLMTLTPRVEHEDAATG